MEMVISWWRSGCRFTKYLTTKITMYFSGDLRHNIFCETEHVADNHELPENHHFTAIDHKINEQLLERETEFYREK